MPDSQLAVLIDFENVGLSSVQRLFDQVSDVGRVIVKRAYADWSENRSQRDQLLELGIEPVHLFHSVRSGKNASDMRLAIDAVDLLYQSEVDTFVIVSSDSDFVPLVNRLRAAGKMVMGAGPEATAPRTLVIACDRFFYLTSGARQAARPRTLQRKPDKESLLNRAVTASMDGEGTVNGSKLYETLQRLDPSFDFRAEGYSTFTRYLDASSEVEVTRGPDAVVVVLADSDSTPTGGEVDPTVWGQKIDSSWTSRARRSGEFIHGNTAARTAATTLGVPKLGDSRYKTLQKLIDASDLLRANWRRDGSRIIRR